MKRLPCLFGLIAMMIAGRALAQAQAQSTPCTLSGADMAAFGALDYEAFNYGPDGWRALAEKKCYYDVAASIVSWLADHEHALDPAQLRTEHYQAARYFALAGRKNVALVHVRMARIADTGTAGSMDWNAYMDAFESWLQADRRSLGNALARLEQQRPDKTGQKPNLAAAQRFARCFARDYVAIEQDASCLPLSSSEKTP